MTIIDSRPGTEVLGFLFWGVDTSPEPVSVSKSVTSVGKLVKHPEGVSSQGSSIKNMIALV